MSTISKKAYADFTARFRHIFIESASQCDESLRIAGSRLYDEAVALLDSYLDSGDRSVDLSALSREVSIAFMMIRTEIDKAVARSASARQRALMRKSRKAAEAISTPSQPAETVAETEMPEYPFGPVQTTVITVPESEFIRLYEPAGKSVAAPRPATVPCAPGMSRRERRARERRLAAFELVRKKSDS